MSSPRKNYFTGQFRHTLDDKGRCTVPSAWRKNFEKEDQFLAIPNPGGYVTVLPPAEADKLYDKFAEVPLGDTEAQDEISTFFASTQAFKFDGAGRLALMESLFSHANLEGPKAEVVLVGGMNKFNIYSSERWAAIQAKSTPATQGNTMRRFGI
ncbi:division/cell wall cluster transcriptional repressor MraZ [Actomonas aquatica]|uniref:Transcriptional regulator MraZ n=1 Tax=Actomonas aquatica TaxID=2866162 RepID=A0ABZ1CBR3_9BACT|nr:mraZ [Opitutus sp. WL0086]WRQ89113.1 mraZ [Opitutus sp. WL0086]